MANYRTTICNAHELLHYKCKNLKSETQIDIIACLFLGRWDKIKNKINPAFPVACKIIRRRGQEDHDN